MSSPHAFTIPARYGAATKTFSGGQGKVSICKDKSLNRHVAIKVMKDVDDTDALQAEIASLSAIQSKHVVQIYDFLKDSKNSAVAIVQEYLDGDDLSKLIGKVKSTDQYFKILFQISSGVADIHLHGKIHRDIKPINMKFDSEGILKIFDFGLACDHKPAPVTTSGRGTDIYRAPELYSFAPVTFSSAVDTYAFGVSAWELLHEKFPSGFLEMPPFSRTAPPSFAAHSIALPATITSVLDLTLSPDPAKRPTMADLRDLIAAHLVYGKHEGRLTYEGKSHELAGANKSVSVKIPGYAGFTLLYDGFVFCVRDISGSVYVSGISAVENSILPNSCVIGLMSRTLGQFPRYLTFDISHPEVIL